MKVLLPDIASQPIEIDIVSNTPGRVRLKVDHEHRLPEILTKIATALTTFAELDRVRTNINNGSLTIYYNPEKVNFAELISQLHSFGVIIDDIPENIANNSSATARLTGAIAGIDRKVKQTTEESLDLRSLFTTLLSIFALRQLAKVPAFRNVSWFIFAWYIFNRLIEFNRSEKLLSQKQLEKDKSTKTPGEVSKQAEE
jgi:hypothetical protein